MKLLAIASPQLQEALEHSGAVPVLVGLVKSAGGWLMGATSNNLQVMLSLIHVLGWG